MHANIRYHDYIMIIIAISIEFLLGFSVRLFIFFLSVFFGSWFGYFHRKSRYSFEIEITELDDRRVGYPDFFFIYCGQGENNYCRRSEPLINIRSRFHFCSGTFR